MKTCRAIVPADGRTVLDRVGVALSMWARFRGLMMRRELADGEGLLIPHCHSIHSCFMRFPIDVVYLDGEHRIAKIVEAMKPCRVSTCMKADTVLEAPAGWARKAELTVGSILRFEPLDEGA